MKLFEDNCIYCHDEKKILSISYVEVFVVEIIHIFDRRDGGTRLSVVSHANVNIFS